MQKSKVSLDEILLFAILIFGPIAHGLVETWSITIVHVAAISLFSIAVLTKIYRGEFRIYRTPIDIPILFFLIAVFISFSTSVYPYASRIVVYEGITGLIFYFFVVNILRSSEKISRLLWMIVVFGTLYAVMGLILVDGSILGFRIFSKQHYNISLFFVNHNHFAGYLEMVFFLSIGLAMANKGGKRVVLFGAGILVAAAVLFSLSRGGIIGFIGGLSFYIIAFAFIQKEKKGTLLLTAFALVAFAVLAWLGLEPVLDRLNTLEDLSIAGEGRFEVWQGTLQMITERPLFGRGPGTFAFAFPPYQTELFAGKFVNYAHNDYLELAADTGLAGLLTFLCALLFLFVSCLRKLTATKNRYRQAVGVGALAACFSILIHSLTDCNLQIPSNLILFAVAAGIAVVSAESSENKKKKKENVCAVVRFGNNLWKTVGCVSVCLATFLAVVAVITPYLGDKYLETAWVHQYKGEHDKAVAAMEKGIFVNPDNAELIRAMGDILLTKAAREDNYYDIKNCTWQKKALHWYEKAIRSCSVKGSYFNKKGYLLEQLGQAAEAEEAYRQAIQRYPMHASTYYNLAALYLKEKQIDKALKYYRGFLELGKKKELNKVLDDIWSAGGEYETQKKAVPETAVFRQAFAAYLKANGENELAVREYSYAFSLDPTERNALVHLRGLCRNKDFSGAFAESEKYLRSFPEEIRIKEQHAVILVNLGRNKEAIRIYQSLLDKSDERNKDGKYYVRIAQLYAKDKLYNEAVVTLEQGIAKNPRNHSLYYHMGINLRPMKKPEETLAAFKKAVALARNNVWCRYQLGVEYQRNRLEQEAMEEWKECLAIKPGFAPCKKAVDRLEKQFGLESGSTN